MTRAVATLGALLLGLQGVPALAADMPEVLALTLNGRVTGMVGEFQRCDGQPCALAADLIALGLIVPPALAASTTPILLSALPDVHVRIDEAQQVIYITAGNAALQATEVGHSTLDTSVPLSPSGYGAVLNYDILGNVSTASSTVAALVNVRAFGPFGVFENAAIVTLLPPLGQKRSLRRLSTVYTYSDENRLLRVRVGDIVTGALAWNRAVRLGGIQISSDFTLRPDLVTYPLPTIQSSAVVPSTVSLIANGVQQSSTAVPPGPFSVHMLPVITGAGEPSVAVQDALGRQTVITLPFYASSDLLKPGLTSYSLEAGMIRENYGLATDHYVNWAVNASARRGVTDWLTMETHGEASNGLTQLGIGATARIGALGIANFALSGSTRGHAAPSNSHWGGLASIGFQRIAHRFNFSINATFDTVGYRDTAAIQGYSLPKSTVNAVIGYQTKSWGLLGVSYIARDSYGANSDRAYDGRLVSDGGARFRIVNASYSVNVASIGALRFNGYRDLANPRSYGVSGGFSVFFGGRTNASLGSSLDSGQSTLSANLSNSALQPGDIGYRVQDQEGSAAQRSAELEYYGQWGRVTGGIDQSPGGVSGRVGARGSLALIDGTVFASDHIDDSFAVVRTGNVGNIPVQYENRPIGVTNAKGQLIVPSLISYQNNRLSLDPSRLPSDVVVGQAFAIVRPRNGSGIIVDLPIKRVHAAVVRLHDGADKAIPVGSIVETPGTPPQTVGYDGEAYMQDLKAENTLKVTRPDGTMCTAHVHYQPVAGDIPAIGPVPCL